MGCGCSQENVVVVCATLNTARQRLGKACLSLEVLTTLDSGLEVGPDPDGPVPTVGLGDAPNAPLGVSAAFWFQQ